MVLGGLKIGATPLGWTYAYTTLGNDGDRVSGTLAARPGDSPVAYTEVTDQDGDVIRGGDNDSIHTQVIDAGVAEEAKSILETVVSTGTGTRADIGAEGQWGKTGTTENNGDAWFCGATEDVTACVWVGYADTTTPMLTEYAGAPVDGGTFPALIWAGVISAWEQIAADRAADREASEETKVEGEDEGESGGGETSEEEDYVLPVPVPEEESAPEPEAPETTPSQEPAPEPQQQSPPQAPAPSAPESGGGGGITAG
jgi:penicillin-binding protein 1A